jgi:hypothetical protein
MRLQHLYFVGAFAAAAIPLSAGAQSLPANDHSTTNTQTVSQAARKCPPGWVGSLPDISGAANGALLAARRAVAQ